MVSLAVCDDSAKFIELLSASICRFMDVSGFEYDIEFFTSGNDLYEAVERGLKIDILLLDIKMPDIDGKDLAAKLRRKDKLFKLIFISSHDNEVFDVFDYNVSCFIQKSRVNEKLKGVLQRVLDELAQDRKELVTYIVIENKMDRTTIRIHPKDIIYFSTKYRDVTLHSNWEHKSFELGRIPIDELESEHGRHGFYRLDRQTLVNMNYVCSFGTDYVMLDDGEKLHLSRRRKNDFEEQYLALLVKK